MNRRSWKVWVAGISLAQLLVIDVDVAVLIPSEAERAAAKIEVGMTWEQATQLLPALSTTLGERVSIVAYRVPVPLSGPFFEFFDDGSVLTVTLDVSGACVETIQPTRATHPLTRLRRTLARVFPALAE